MPSLGLSKMAGSAGSGADGIQFAVLPTAAHGVSDPDGYVRGGSLLLRLVSVGSIGFWK